MILLLVRYALRTCLRGQDRQRVDSSCRAFAAPIPTFWRALSWEKARKLIRIIGIAKYVVSQQSKTDPVMSPEWSPWNSAFVFRTLRIRASILCFDNFIVKKNIFKSLDLVQSYIPISAFDSIQTNASKWQTWSKNSSIPWSPTYGT